MTLSIKGADPRGLCDFNPLSCVRLKGLGLLDRWRTEPSEFSLTQEPFAHENPNECCDRIY